jgi:DNA-binding LytR/AlgR family response regulator
MNPAPRAIIADDEPALAEHLARELHALWPALRIDGIAGNGREALAMVRAHDPDVVFLDIRMPGLDGVGVARALPDDIALVFVTAYEEHAVAAFERAAVDYLLKPVTRERLGETVRRLRSRLEDARTPATGEGGGAAVQQAAGEMLRKLLADLDAGSGKAHADEPNPRPATGRALQWLRAGHADRVELVHVDEVVYFEADLKYTTVKTRDRELLLRKPLSELEDELDADRFWRVHRSLIVNVGEVAEARRDLRGRFVLTLRSRPERLRVSQRYAGAFRQM